MSNIAFRLKKARNTKLEVKGRGLLNYEDYKMW